MANEWIKDFYRLFDADDKNSIVLLLKHYPDKIIKFCGGNEYSLEALKKNQVWLSSPKKFNDPFDCAINMGEENLELQILKDMGMAMKNGFGEKMINSISPELMEISNEINKKIREDVETVKNAMFVCCFSDGVNLINSTMWGHYACNHKGFCIEYSKEFMIKEIKEMILPVDYEESIEPFYMRAFGMSDNRLQHNTVYTKALDWQNEMEWRLLVVDENKSGQEGFLMDNLKASKVYVGCKASQMLIDELKIICKEKGIELYQMKMDPNSFNLSYDLIST